jgi:hypothetical protein
VINAGTVSARVPIAGNGQDFLFYNDGTNEAFVNVGDGTVLAVAAAGTNEVGTGNVVVPPGMLVVYDFGAQVAAVVATTGTVNVAGVTATGSALLRISQGRGS